MPWKDIKTAPTDGTEVWLGAQGRVIIGYRSSHDGWRSSWSNIQLPWEPTHWKPFVTPKPPVTNGDDHAAG